MSEIFHSFFVQKRAENMNISTSGKAIFDSEKWDETATNENCFLWNEDGTTIIGLDEEKLAGVTKIRIPSKCTVIRSDYAMSISDDYRNLIKQMLTIEIPDTVTEIGKYAFYVWRNLEKVTIPSNITSIGEHAFWNCNNLTNIIIPDSVTSIDGDAFCDCSSLINITYNGTQEQWNNISKKSNWRYDSVIKTVTCTDGVIQVN